MSEPAMTYEPPENELAAATVEIAALRGDTDGTDRWVVARRDARAALIMAYKVRQLSEPPTEEPLL